MSYPLTIHGPMPAADWVSQDPLLAQFEIGQELDGGVYGGAKMGPGHWNSLSYWNPSAAPIIQTAVLQADFPKVNQTLTAVTGWDKSINLVAGHIYRVTGQLYMTGATGGVQFDFNGGSAVMTGMSGGILGYQVDAGAARFEAAYVLFVGFSDVVAAYAPFDFTCEVSASGTLIPRFSQQTTDAGVSALKKYSTIVVQDVTP